MIDLKSGNQPRERDAMRYGPRQRGQALTEYLVTVLKGFVLTFVVLGGASKFISFIENYYRNIVSVVNLPFP